MENDNPWRADTRRDAAAIKAAMWATRDHRYGGLAGRYEKNHRRMIRIMDPFTATMMQFSTTLRADNWLLRNFCPGSIRTHVPSEGLFFLQKGTVSSARCDLITEFRDGVQFADLVIACGESAVAAKVRWFELRGVVSAFGLVPVLRHELDIRANAVLLCNLDRMCQHLVLHDTQNWRQEDQIRAAIPSNGSISVFDLQVELRFSRYPMPSPEHFDSALFRLYRQGNVTINLAEMTYGPSSSVSRARHGC